MSDDLGNLIKGELAPSETIAVHGTSVEAALYLLEKGRLALEPFSTNPFNLWPGYLFFTPHVAHFQSHPLAQLLRNGYLGLWRDTLSCTLGAAQYNAQLHFVALKTGHYCGEVMELPFDPSAHFPPRTMHPFEQKMLETVISHLALTGMTRNQAMRYLKEANKRKGVLIGIGLKGFELHFEEGHEDPEGEVRIYLPNGLDLKYVSGIMPLGEAEKGLLNDFLQKQEISGPTGI